jgi:site-specific recombinase XerC
VLRSCEVLALDQEDLILSEAQIRVRGKGNKVRMLPLAPEAVQLLDYYLRLERPPNCGAALFVCLKGRARGTRLTAAGLRSLFRHHRQATGVAKANPHRFRHYAPSRTMPPPPRADDCWPWQTRRSAHVRVTTMRHSPGDRITTP